MTPVELSLYPNPIAIAEPDLCENIQYFYLFCNKKEMNFTFKTVKRL